MPQLTEQQVRQIIREELRDLLFSDRYIFKKLIQMLDGRNMQFGRSVGTKIGTEGGDSGQKFGFWNTTPVTQPAAIADPNNVSGTYNQSEVQDIVDKVKLILDKLQDTGFIQT